MLLPQISSKPHLSSVDHAESRKSLPLSGGSITYFSTDQSHVQHLNNLEKVQYVLPAKDQSPSFSRIVLTSSSSRHVEGTSLSVSPSSAGNTHSVEEWINQKSLSSLLSHHNLEICPIRFLYDRVLANEERFVRGIGKLVRQQEKLNLRKKEVLYKKWQEQVYLPLRKEIEKSMNEGYAAIDNARRREFDKYLEYKNKMGDVFLDVISAEDYDPLVLFGQGSPVALRATTPRLKDPVHLNERHRIDEEMDLLRCDTGEKPTRKMVLSRKRPPRRLVPLGRNDSKDSSWLALALQNMDSPGRCRSRQRMDGKEHRTVIDFATWSSTTFQPEVIDRELRIQKKRRFHSRLTVPPAETLELAEKSGVRFASPPVSSTV